MHRFDMRFPIDMESIARGMSTPWTKDEEEISLHRGERGRGSSCLLVYEASIAC